jgi:CHAT domain-containing protein
MASTRNLLVQTASVQMNQIELWGGIDYSTAKAPVFNYLPGTLTEVNKIKGMTVGKSTVIAGALAKEERFKQLDGKSPAVLHVATHGFFYPEPSNDASSAQTLNRFMGAKDPMLRAGLALSGANIGWDSTQIKGSKEDGILTAYEISVMDLSKTKLVILSACETGLGDIQSGEGVYGLQRAFKLAGVDYLIMSLWQVPDQETQVFMELLYNNALKGMAIEEAFRRTQLTMSQKYDPYQWAAFVLLK